MRAMSSPTLVPETARALNNMAICSSMGRALMPPGNSMACLRLMCMVHYLSCQAHHMALLTSRIFCIRQCSSRLLNKAGAISQVSVTCVEPSLWQVVGASLFERLACCRGKLRYVWLGKLEICFSNLQTENLLCEKVWGLLPHHPSWAETAPSGGSRMATYAWIST